MANGFAKDHQFPRYAVFTEYIPANRRPEGRYLKHEVVVHAIQMEYVASQDVRSIEGYPVAVIEYRNGRKAGCLESVPVERIKM